MLQTGIHRVAGTGAEPSVGVQALACVSSSSLKAVLQLVVCHWLRQCFALLFLIVGLAYATQAAAQSSLLTQARTHVAKTPTARNYLALAVLESVEPGGQGLAMPLPAGLQGPDAVALYEWLCWQSIPLTATETPRFEQRLAQWRQLAKPPGPLLPVFELYRAHKAGDRQGQSAAAGLVGAIDTWPTAAAEVALFELLRALGMSRTEAGVFVISHRRHDSLYALADLDRGLTREADFLSKAGQSAEAATLTACRDRLRTAYVTASKQLVPRLFALKLLGREDERRKLHEQSRQLAYLHDVGALNKTLNQLDDEQAWTLLVEPLLKDELKLIAAPPQWTLAQATLAQAAAPRGPELVVEAASKDAGPQGTRYEGRVRVSWGEFKLTCEKLTVNGQDTDRFGFLATGQVEAEGLFGRATAQEAKFDAQRRTFVFSGHVRLHARGSNEAKMAELLEVGANGAVVRQHNLLDEFRQVQTHEQRLALLPRITVAYGDDELPDDVRYLLALSLLKPHLSWHVGHVDDAGERRKFLSRERQDRWNADTDSGIDTWRWDEAHDGEEWLRAEQQARLDAEWLQQKKTRETELFKRTGQRLQQPAAAKGAEKFPVFWQLKDPAAPDVARAIGLLRAIRENKLVVASKHWVAELQRNNTVLTFDILGGYALAKNGPVVLDSRCADKVTLKLYRVSDPKELLTATEQIGRDYMYRDYGLQSNEGVEQAAMLSHELEARRLIAPRHRSRELLRLNAANLVATWQVQPSELPRVPASRHDNERHDRWDDGDIDADSEHFDDRCEWFRERIEKSYRRSYQPSTWRTDRVVRVPAEALKERGAYILVGEANGQRAYAPLLVEPLSLTLRRCRDGVFALLSDAEGFQPVAGASLLAAEQFGPSWTDQGGASFVRVFAAGDRSIIGVKHGRYAIGGFGDLFEGIYDTWEARQRHWDRPEQAVQKLRQQEEKLTPAAQIYADDHLVAAYTDRPTYRPGQMANFKLIVRLIHRDRDGQPDPKRPFRAEDFDLAGSLRLPKPNTEVRYEVVNPKGRAVATGVLTLNDFGTAAGSFPLSAESAVGNYSLRVWLSGTPRVVPDVLAVQYYRRPNFELAVAGVPDRVEKPAAITLAVTGRYYFGKPVGGGKVQVRLVRPDEWKPLAEVAGDLSADGRVEIRLPVPERLEAQRYFVVTSLTDDSGRTVTDSKPYEVRSSGAADVSRLAAPRFAAVGAAFDVRSSGEKVTIDGETGVEIRDGRARITLSQVGWHTLSAAGEETSVFIYGGREHPQWGVMRGVPAKQQQEGQAMPARKAGEPRLPDPAEKTWVNLTNFEWQEERSYDRVGRWEQEGAELLGMFEGHHATVGGKLRLLVYVPYKKARLLLSVEGETIVDYQLNTVEGSESFYHVIEVPVPERYLPNFYLQGRVLAWEGMELQRKEQEKKALRDRQEELDDQTEDPRWCRVDVLDPEAKAAQPQLNVEVVADRAQYRPGEEVRARIKVTDLQGRPATAEVSLAAVDESVFSFGEDQLDALPQAFVSYHPPRRYAQKVWRSYRSRGWTAAGQERLADHEEIERLQNQLQKLAQAQKSMAATLQSLESSIATRTPRPRLNRPARPQGEMPATSISLARLRTDFRETAAWQPQLRVGADGSVDTTFRLPDSLTAYRLSAVALTRDTQIGIGRSSLKVTQPLSVQMMLPRFAVESDRLLAVGLIHNEAGQPRTCKLLWQVAGAKVDGHEGVVQNVGQKQTEGETSAEMSVTIPARGTARVGLWLEMNAIGTVRASLTANDTQETDAEQRTLEVVPLGRPREVYLSGTFRGKQTLSLPKRFVARELRLSLARSDVARSLDSLAYLVDFPYGCVEQTMSRFLPAVAVKHAAQQAPVNLPPNIAAKLPKVLEQGLSRLYNFQHQDGGWGWWEHDATNNQMTVFVVYGLARCNGSGVRVDANVLARACTYLKRKLRSGAFRNQPGGIANHRDDTQGDDLEARAWLALALAGQAEPRELQDVVLQTNAAQLSAEARCYLSLACREAGLPALAATLWQQARVWQPENNTEDLALNLTCQLAFGEPLNDCYKSAHTLLDRRQGDRWENTHATAWAVQALSGVLSYGVAETGAKQVTATLGGKTILDARRPDEQRQLIHRVALGAGEVPPQEALDVALSANGDEPFSYTLTAVGTQRLDLFEPVGTNLRILRRITALDNAPVTEAVDVGQVIAVHLDIELAAHQQYVMVEDRRPAGFEFASDRLMVDGQLQPANVEFRDDCMLAFFTNLPAGRHRLTYYLRAETKGVSHQLPGRIYPMYQETQRGETGGTELRVK